MKLYSIAGATVLAMVASSTYADLSQADESDADTKTEEDAAGEVQAVTEVTHSDRVLETQVFFDFDKSNLDDGARHALDQAAGWLEGNETSIVLIEGHTDRVGSEAYNKKLGDARATASVDYLVSLGIDRNRITVISYGEAMPTVDTNDKSRENRRIIVFAVDKEPIVKTEYLEKDCPQPLTRVSTEYLKAERERDVVTIEKDGEDPFNFGIVAGGGVVNAIDGETRTMTDPGGLWNVRFMFNTKYVLGVEAAYVGSAQDLDDDQGFSGSSLVGNGLEGALRLNILSGRVRPYAFGGLGWTHYAITNSAISDDDVMTVPAGAGVDIKFADEADDPGFLLDFRGTVRPVVGDELFEDQPVAAGGEDADLDNWSISAQAGYAF